MSEYHKERDRLYRTQRWLRLRRYQLRIQPLCEKCKEKGLTVEADVVHHVIPHKGNKVLFYTGKLQSLCTHCHDGITQQQERYGFTNDIGDDGWPSDCNHPVHVGRQY